MGLLTDLLTNFAHLHIILNHFPTIGTVVALGLYLGSFHLNSEDLRRGSLVVFLVMALLAIPTYISGGAAERAVLGRADIDTTLISTHQDAAMLAFVFLGITGCFSWLALWQYRRFQHAPNWNLIAILVLSVLTVGLMIRTGNRGGEISHPEIRAVQDAAVAQETLGRTAALQAYILDKSWVWPAMETVHFIGMALLFGVVLIVNLRVLGFVKNIPFAPLHRLLPLGVLGFLINVVTGMCFYVADSGRYLAMPGFPPKMALLVIAGMAVLYFTIFDEPWNLKAGDDAPLTSKAMAGATVLLWLGVIYFGRMLPYYGGGG